MRQYYRVESGTMKALVWANGYRQAIRKARAYRNWKWLAYLTKFQIHSIERAKDGLESWGPWHYVKTEIKP